MRLIGARPSKPARWSQEICPKTPSKELKDVQPAASEKPPISTQQPEESSVGANATPILEASKTGPVPSRRRSGSTSRKADGKKRYKKNQEAITPPPKEQAKRQRVTDWNLTYYRAIAKHAIRGVEVSVIDGTVFLGGRVDTENQKIAAAKAASNVPGVKYIRDRIIVNNHVAS